MMEFPKDFFWGAATSSYQVEGDNFYSDWWQWEKDAGLVERSGQACRHYWLFEEDFEIAKKLHHNAHRLSIEWARIEPQEGKFSNQEIEHYLRVIHSLREKNIEPIVTLHHFTCPLWFAQKKGWEHREAVFYFSRYVEKIVSCLADKVRFWVTINEPMVYVYYAYLRGVWPPQKKSFWLARKIILTLASAHCCAYQKIHALYQNKNLKSPLVSIAHNMHLFIPCQKTYKNKLAVFLRDWFFNQFFLKRLLKTSCLDYIGINYYSRHLVDIDTWKIREILFGVCQKDHSQTPKNYLGWDIFPQGLFLALMRLKKYRLPIFILENGICTQDDSQRWDFIREHLKQLHFAMGNGVRVLGYLYWSLLDNFEWDKGFAPRFGLVEVDYSDFSRKIRPSAVLFSQVCQSGKLEDG